MQSRSFILGLALALLVVAAGGCKQRAAAGGDFFVEDTHGWLKGAGTFDQGACGCYYNLTVSDVAAPHDFEFTLSCGPSTGDVPIENVGFTVPGNVGQRYQRHAAATYWLGTRAGSNTLYQGPAALEYEYSDMSDNGDEDESLRTDYIALIIHKLRVPESTAYPVSVAGADPIDVHEAGMDGVQIWCALPGEEFR